MDIKGALSKKVAGVPVIYLAALFVGILAVVAWRMKPSSDEPEAGGDPASENGVDGDPDPYENPEWSANAPPVYVSPDPAAVTGNPTIQTNEQWVAKGTEWLVAQGRASGGNAFAILNRYIDGDQLSYAEGQLRDAVIKQFGVPPEPFVPGSTNKPAEGIATKQGNPPTTHTVKGTKDNNFWKLAKLYYGSDHYDYVNTLEVANISIPKSKDAATAAFPVGTKVTIPKYTAPKYYLATKTVNTPQAIASRNSTTAAAIMEYNDSYKWPVKAGTKVRVA